MLGHVIHILGTSIGSRPAERSASWLHFPSVLSREVSAVSCQEAPQAPWPSDICV
jgi:hypothetical protein